MDQSALLESPATATLRANHLSAWEAIGQSLATLAPTAGPAIIVPLVLASSGNGTWLVFLIATIATVCIGYQINTFARRSSSPGSLYVYVHQGLPRASTATAWALLIAYSGTASGTACSGILYFCTVFAPHTAITPILATLLLVAIVGLGTAFAWFDVKLSTQLMLAMEGLAIVLVLLLFVLPGHGSALHLDHAQLMLTGVTTKQIRGGLVLGFFAFVGFESAASLGGEVIQPLRNIPRAISSSILIGGLFFIVTAYAEQIAFTGQASILATSAAPIKLLSDVRGYPAFGLLLMSWVVTSATANVAACIQATARTLYGMSCDGQCSAALGRIHPRRHSPHIAILITATAIIVPAAALLLSRLQLVDVYGWLGTFATFGFLTAYGLLTIAAVRVQLRTGSFGVQSALCTLVIAVVLVLSISSSFDASATGAYRVLPYLYAVTLIVGLLITARVRRTLMP